MEFDDADAVDWVGLGWLDWAGLDWAGLGWTGLGWGVFCVILVFSRCLEVDTCTSSKLSIYFKYSVTAICPSK